MIAFEDMTLISRANSLAYYELLGNGEWMNHELDKYNLVTPQSLKQYASKIFVPQNCNTIYYYSKS